MAQYKLIRKGGDFYRLVGFEDHVKQGGRVKKAHAFRTFVGVTMLFIALAASLNVSDIVAQGPTVIPSPTMWLPPVWTLTPSQVPTIIPPNTWTPIPSSTNTRTPVASATSTQPPALTPTPSPTMWLPPVWTLTPSSTATNTQQPTPTNSSTAPPPTANPTQTQSVTPSVTPTFTQTPTSTGTVTQTLAATVTQTKSVQPSVTKTPTLIPARSTLPPNEGLQPLPLPANTGQGHNTDREENALGAVSFLLLVVATIKTKKAVIGVFVVGVLSCTLLLAVVTGAFIRYKQQPIVVPTAATVEAVLPTKFAVAITQTLTPTPDPIVQLQVRGSEILIDAQVLRVGVVCINSSNLKYTPDAGKCKGQDVPEWDAPDDFGNVKRVGWHLLGDNKPVILTGHKESKGVSFANLDKAEQQTILTLTLLSGKTEKYKFAYRQTVKYNSTDAINFANGIGVMDYLVTYTCAGAKSGRVYQDRLFVFWKKEP